MRQTVPSRSAALPSGSSASISEELRVVAALHEIGADLGDPVEVRLVDGLVVVSGVGIPPERQRDIRRALEDIPFVSVQFSDVASTAGLADPAIDADAPDRASALQSRMEQQFGGRAEFERVSGQLLDHVESAMARVYALRSLAQRFPDGAELPGPDAARLRDLARQHLTVLSAQVNDLHRTLAPVLVSLGGRAVQGRPASARSWQSAVEDLFRSSKRLDVLLSTLFGATHDGASANLPADLLSVFADLKVELDAIELMLQ